MINYIFLIVTSIILYLTYLLVINPYIKIQKLKKKHGSSIFTYYYPLIGAFKLEQKQKGDPLWYTKNIVQQNPDIKAIVSNLGPYVLITILSTQGVKEHLIDHPHKYDKFVPLFLFDQIDQSVIFTKKDKHKFQRKLISVSFDFKAIKNYLPDIKSTIYTRFKQIQDETKKEAKTMKVCEETMNIAGDIGVKLFFGNDFGSQKINDKPIALQLAWLVDKLVSYSHNSIFFNIKRIILGDNSWKWKWVCSKYEKNIIKQANQIQELSQSTIIKRIQYNKSLKEELQNPSFIDVIIQEYLKQQDPDYRQTLNKNQLLTLKEIHQQSLGMYIAGTDNTGVQMGMILYCLAKYKEEAKKVEEEINKFIPNFNQNEISIENINKLDYTHAFIKETFRLHSSSTGQFMRKCNVPHTIDGIFIDKGMMIHPQWYGPFNNPKLYKNPTVINPEHFTGTDNITQQDPFSWSPFSAGPRSCIGMTLSLVEIKIMIIYFIKMFKYEVNEDVTLEKFHSLTLQPINDELIKIKSL